MSASSTVPVSALELPLLRSRQVTARLQGTGVSLGLANLCAASAGGVPSAAPAGALRRCLRAGRGSVLFAEPELLGLRWVCTRLTKASSCLPASCSPLTWQRRYCKQTLRASQPFFFPPCCSRMKMKSNHARL